jgi:hypothetical protein
MVQSESSRAGRQTTKDRPREAAGPLPVLWPVVELPERSLWGFYNAACGAWRKWLSRRAWGMPSPGDNSTTFWRAIPC